MTLFPNGDAAIHKKAAGKLSSLAAGHLKSYMIGGEWGLPAQASG
jgi:hypothetical protein